MKRKLFTSLAITLYVLASIALPAHPNTDAAGDKKRGQLQNVKRLLVVSMFFGTDTLGELPPLKAVAQPDNRHDRKPVLDAKQQADFSDYKEALRKLEGHARETLPARAAARTPFEVIKADEVDGALKLLKLSPPDLYPGGGRLNGKKFELPDPEQVKRIASQLHVDAVLLGVLDEPRKSNGGYYFDPLTGPGYDSPKVHDKATFDLLLADGTPVLRQTIDVVHPLTKIGKRQFVVADWIETEDQIIEDLMDEVTRFTPKR